MKIAIISDTHSLLREEVIETIKKCDVILHSGDIASKKTMEAVKTLGEAYFVRGNADKNWAEEIPWNVTEEIGGYRFYMTHKKSDIPKDLKDVDFVIYGHSHKYEVKEDKGITYLNPGSCGPRRFTQPVTMMVMTVDEKTHTWKVEKKDFSPVLKKGDKQPPKKELDIIIKQIIKDMNANKSVEKIAEKNRVDKEFVEEILQIYTTHPGIDIDGILNRMK